MKRLLIGFVCGFLLASALGVPALLFVKNEKYKHGHDVGYLNGQSDVVAFLQKHFKVQNPSLPRDQWDDVLWTKAGNVYILNLDGKLTIETN